MIDEGRLSVTLTVGGREVVDVALASTRPRQAARVLVERQVDDALRTAPLLFSLCGTAHGLAVAEAVERAAGLRLAPAHDRARAILAAIDALEGHGWTVLLDWPKLIAEPAGAFAYASLCRFTTELRGGLYPYGDALVFGGGRLAPDPVRLTQAIDGVEGVIHEQVLGTAAFAGDASAFREWSRRAETVAARLVDRVFAEGHADQDRATTGVPLLPELDGSWFDAQLADEPDFGIAPLFEGQPAEVGPAARMREDPLVAELASCWGHGIVTRLGARLVELAELPRRLRELVADLEAAEPQGEVGAVTGEGAGVVETSRGPLAYRLELEDGVVASAASVAPTEWNFHERGALVQSLRGAPVQGAERRAQLLVASLDPCVPYVVRTRSQSEPPEVADA